MYFIQKTLEGVSQIEEEGYPRANRNEGKTEEEGIPAFP